MTIDDEARRWLTLMSEQSEGKNRLGEFEVWLKTDARHREAFARVEAVWSGLGQLDEFRGRYTAADLGRFAPAVEEEKPHLLVSRSWPIALAACLVVSVVAFLFAGMLMPSPLEYETNRAQLREVVLPDGSMASLDAQSRILIDFNDEMRSVELLRGAAFFVVEPDAQRPFFVTARKTRVRVVGTQFEVRHGAEGISVAVAEGKVHVLNSTFSHQIQAEGNNPHPEHEHTLLTAGQQLRAASNGLAHEIKQISEAAPGSWRAGRLFYDDTRLADVIADVSRYFDGRIEIQSQSVGDLRITGSFRTDRIEQVFASLEEILPVDVDHRNAKHVTVSEKK